MVRLLAFFKNGRQAILRHPGPYVDSMPNTGYLERYKVEGYVYVRSRSTSVATAIFATVDNLTTAFEEFSPQYVCPHFREDVRRRGLLAKALVILDVESTR
jgi:hypothetical protein